MADAPHVMITDAQFYPDLADALFEGAVAELNAVGATFERFTVPGAFELPAALQMAIRSMDFFTGRRRFDGYIALGTVIRGETSHYDYVCSETSRALMDLSVRYTERLHQAGIETSAGSVGDSYDNALAEAVNALYKAEVIRCRGPWPGLEGGKHATPEGGEW